jgi:hypothetical protein
MSNVLCKCIAVLTLGMAIAGCGPGGPSLYKAGGTVTYNGQPVSGANVTFQYEDGNSASGVTDAAGKYTLTYLGNPKGAAVGKCMVSVSKIAAIAGAPSGSSAEASKDPAAIMKMMQGMGEAQMKGEAGPPKNELPAKYVDFKTSGLSFEITTDEAKNNFEIVLKD